MIKKANDLVPAFPQNIKVSNDNEPLEFQWCEGLSLRGWFATFTPEPTADDYAFEYKQDQYADPHNDKGKRRNRDQIRAYLKFKMADAMVAEHEKGAKP